MTTLSRAPIYVQLDRQRELRFNLNSAILLRDAGFDAKPLAVKREGGDYEVQLDVLRAYLWAGLARDAAINGYEQLSLEQVGDLINRDQIMTLVVNVQRALMRFYGQEPSAKGEEEAAAPGRGSRSRGRSKRGSASSVAN